LLVDLLRDGAEQESADGPEPATAHDEEIGGGRSRQEPPGRIPEERMRVDPGSLAQRPNDAGEHVAQPRLLLLVRVGREGPDW
jgi:hypothetical protein